MKQLPFTLLIALVLFGCDIRKSDKIDNQTLNEAALKAPTTVEIIDSVHNFGTIKEGELVLFNFRFKNTGVNPLVIIDAKASCGCTIAEKPEQPIMPGEIGYIKARFNSEHKPGEAHKAISITSNASPAFPELLLKGTVIGKTEEE